MGAEDRVDDRPSAHDGLLAVEGPFSGGGVAPLLRTVCSRSRMVRPALV